MQYELVSRALAYVSCFSAMSLLMTSMAIAAVNVGKIRPLSSCAPGACVAGVWIESKDQFGGLASRAHVEKVAAELWSAKI